MNDILKKKSEDEAKRLFELFRGNKAIIHARGKEYIGLTEDGLASLVYSAMVDGAEIAVNKLKAK